MFEADIIELLEQSTDVVDNISTFDGVPSIFTNDAPEKVDFPYIVFNIRSITPPDSIINRYMIDLHVFDYNDDNSTIRKIVNSIENTLDNTRFSNDRYTDIRVRRDIMSPIPTGDPRGLQYHIQIEARATRKEWMTTI